MNEELELTEPETVELTEAASEPGLLDKPFDDYTVTEGLLFVIALLLLLQFIRNLLKDGLSWLT